MTFIGKSLCGVSFRSGGIISSCGGGGYENYGHIGITPNGVQIFDDENYLSMKGNCCMVDMEGSYQSPKLRVLTNMRLSTKL